METIGKIAYPKKVVDNTQPLEVKCVFKTTTSLPAITWRKNGKLLQNGQEYAVSMTKKGSTTIGLLLIANPSKL